MSPDQEWGALPSILDVIGPYRGRCAACGGPDQRHRLADALVESVRAGDSVPFVAHAYGVSEAIIDALCDWPIPRDLADTWDAYLRSETLKAAGHELGVSYVTVSRRLAAIRSILGVSTNVQAADVLARTLSGSVKNAA